MQDSYKNSEEVRKHTSNFKTYKKTYVHVLQI